MSVTKQFALQGGAHTAGIFADHSADGPVIGTLVAVVDRAKNLPNRKTIGKQDPYCAARLGKEAKKTATDIRGGQTPKWDQELRFTVHDSPDYFQLKVSVFTDDKRTDLIGETWIDLKNIIIAGGGQSDVWQSLSCKGKYAGEIRIEITYYDSRPKPERAAVKTRTREAADVDGGSTRQRGGGKQRRPLPSDPVTGEVPSPAIPEHLPQQTPPRKHTKRPSHAGVISNQSPLQSIEYGTPPAYATPSRRGRESDYGMPQQHDLDYDDHDDGYEMDTPSHYSSASEMRGSPRNLPPIDTHQGPPPPPPAHRSRQNSAAPEPSPRGSAETSPQKMGTPQTMRHGVLRNEAHRHTGSTSNIQYQPYQSTASSAPISPRHERSASHAAPYAHGREGSFDSYSRGGYGGDEMHFDSGPGQSPYSRSPGHITQSPRPYSSRGDDNDIYGAPSPMSAREFAPHSPGHATQGAHARRPSYREDYDPSPRGAPSGYGIPPPPSSLSHTVDPRLSRDVASRVYEDQGYDERLYQQTANGRGRQWSEPPPSYGGRRAASPQPPMRPQPERRATGQYPTSSHEASMEHARRMSASPNPNHRIPRKSVSPAPHSEDHRRLSDVPFGPDSYDALNPSVVSSRSDHSGTSGLEKREINGKIIGHTGVEVDPSDHLPMETWAPEPEPRPGSRQPTPEPGASRPRQSLSGAQPMPPQDPRVKANRKARQSYNHQEEPPRTARLQKKPRGSSVSPGASPLAPMAPDQYHDNRYNGYASSPSRYGGRSQHDYENYGPPVPAKVPMHHSESMSLADEMQRIDIGAGRSRRRGGY